MENKRKKKKKNTGMAVRGYTAIPELWSSALRGTSVTYMAVPALQGTVSLCIMND